MSVEERNIVLIGFMGTGKTTVGQELSHELGWRFVDTDQSIEQKEGCTLPELFASKGEPHFRDAESAMLAEVLRKDRQIVSTGGGAVLRPANRDVMLAGGFVVALTAPQEALLDRLRGDAARPLLAGDKEERVRLLLKERKNAYDFAHFTVDTSLFTVRQAVDIIIERAQRFRP